MAWPRLFMASIIMTYVGYHIACIFLPLNSYAETHDANEWMVCYCSTKWCFFFFSAHQREPSPFSWQMSWTPSKSPNYGECSRSIAGRDSMQTIIEDVTTMPKRPAAVRGVLFSHFSWQMCWIHSKSPHYDGFRRLIPGRKWQHADDHRRRDNLAQSTEHGGENISTVKPL